MRSHRSLFHTTLPFFLLARTARVVGPDDMKVAGFWLQCQRRDCMKFFLVTADTLTASTYLTRSCPGCFAASQLPRRLWSFVPEPRPEDG